MQHSHMLIPHLLRHDTLDLHPIIWYHGGKIADRLVLENHRVTLLCPSQSWIHSRHPGQPGEPRGGWGQDEQPVGSWSWRAGLGEEPRAGQPGVLLSPETMAGHWGSVGSGGSLEGWDAGQGYGWGEGTEGSLRCSTQKVLQQENNTYSSGATENQENKV